MLYFIAWVVFLLVVVLAVPIAAFLEKRRYAAANPRSEIEDDQASFEEAESADPGEPDDGFGGEEVVEFGEVEATGGDDFSAFDAEFK